MTDLTETLLWLNRKADKPIPIKPLALGALIYQLIEELSHMHKGKAVMLLKETDESCFPQPEALCRIVITNLLRNAFQYTQKGFITIKQPETTIIINNKNMKQAKHDNKISNENSTNNELGLGLELTERLVKQFGWRYSNIATTTGHHVEIDFSESN
jgi:signal transduction histidine kinase